MHHCAFGIISRLNNTGEREYLLTTSHGYAGEHTGKFYPPGGWINIGEPAAQAAQREILEELGLTVKPVREIVVLPGDLPNLMLHFWACELISGEITPDPQEVQQVGWFTLEQMQEIEIYPATRKVFQEYVN